MYVPILNHSGREIMKKKKKKKGQQETQNYFISFHLLSIFLGVSNSPISLGSNIKRLLTHQLSFSYLLNFVVNTKCYFPSCEVKLAAALANHDNATPIHKDSCLACPYRWKKSAKGLEKLLLLAMLVKAAACLSYRCWVCCVTIVTRDEGKKWT